MNPLPVPPRTPHAPASRGRRIREACGHFRRPQKPLSEHTEYPKSRSMGLFWNLNRAPVTTFAPVRAGKAQKCDPSEPARAGRIPRALRENGFSAPAPSPLEFFTRLFLEYTILLEPFFLRTPARRTWGRRTEWADAHCRRPRRTNLFPTGVMTGLNYVTPWVLPIVWMRLSSCLKLALLLKVVTKFV